MNRSPNIVRLIKCRRLNWTGHVARMEEGTSTFKISTGTPIGRWDDNIRMDLKEIDISTKNWVDWSKDRDCWKALVNAALNIRIP